jgi:rhomboid protease GluP
LSPGNYPPEGFVPSAVRVAQFRRALFTATPRVFIIYALIAINCGVFVVMAISGVSPIAPGSDPMIRWGANFGPYTIGHGQWWRLLTAAFLHFGVAHLALNMYALYLVGTFVERLLGNAGFLIMYLVSGLFASVASLAFHPSDACAGASGAVFGVFGALGGFLVRQRHTIPPELRQRLGKSTLGLIGVNLVFSLAVPAVDMSAHVGGLIAGFLCALVQAQPLTPRHPTGRLLRNAATALGGMALIVLGAYWVASLGIPVDYGAEIDHFAEIEKDAIEQAYSLRMRAGQRQITDKELVHGLEEKVLPSWREERERLGSLKRLSSEQQKHLAQILEYMNAREEAWQLFAEAVRDDDPRKFKLSQEKEQAVHQMIEEMKTRNQGK